MTNEKAKQVGEHNTHTARRSSQEVQIMGSYKMLPEIGKVRFSDGKNSILVDAMFKDGQFYLSLENTEKVAKWSILQGNNKGHGLLDHLTNFRINNGMRKGDK